MAALGASAGEEKWRSLEELAGVVSIRDLPIQQVRNQHRCSVYGCTKIHTKQRMIRGILHVLV